MIKRDAEAIDDLERARYGTVRIGFVRAFDPARARVRVAWATGESGDVLSDWVPWATWAAGHLRVWSPPAIGEQVILLSPSGEIAQAIAMPSVHQQSGQWPAPSNNPQHTVLAWDDGAFIRYERDTGRMFIHAPNLVRITSQRIELN